MVCSARIAASRPAPGPFTRTFRVRMPKALAALPAAIAAWVAANGVPLRDPLNPIPPALDHATTFPSGSVMVTVVLLNDAWIWARPWWMMRFSPRFLNVFFFAGRPAFFPPSAVGVAEASTASFFAMLCLLFLVLAGPHPRSRPSAGAALETTGFARALALPR